MKMDCELVCDLLPFYKEGKLGEKTLEGVENHLKKCARCRAKYASEVENLPQNIDVEEKFKLLSRHRRHRRNRKIFIATVVLFVLGLSVVDDLFGFLAKYRFKKKIQKFFGGRK